MNEELKNNSVDIDKDKIKLLFSLVGELVVMIMSFFNIFKKNESK